MNVAPPHAVPPAGEMSVDEETANELVVQRDARLERDSSLEMGDEAATLFEGGKQHTFLSIILTNLQVSC